MAQGACIQEILWGSHGVSVVPGCLVTSAEVEVQRTNEEGARPPTRLSFLPRLSRMQGGRTVPRTALETDRLRSGDRQDLARSRAWAAQSGPCLPFMTALRQATRLALHTPPTCTDLVKNLLLTSLIFSL